MKQTLILIAALIPAAVSAQSSYGALRYDYVAGMLALPDTDEVGIEFEGSTAATERIVVFGRFRDLEPIRNLDLRSMEIGVGRILHLRPNLDFIPSMSYGYNEFDRRGVQRDEDGLIVSGQVRGWMSSRVELAAALILDDSRGSSTDTVLEFGVQAFRRPVWSYGGRVRHDDYDTTVFLGTRWYFGASRRPLGQ